MNHSRTMIRKHYPSGHPDHSPRRPAISCPPPSHILWPIVPAAHLPHFPIDAPAVNLKAGVVKADIYDSTFNPAREEDLSHLALLQMMVQDEIKRREAKKLQRRIAKALWIFSRFSCCRQPPIAMCSHIPNRGEQMVRYYGYYSNVSQGKRRQEGLYDAIPCILEPQGNEKAFRKSWARLSLYLRTDRGGCFIFSVGRFLHRIFESNSDNILGAAGISAVAQQTRQPQNNRKKNGPA